MNDGRNPAECHWATGFDGSYVCKLCCAPCAGVGLCPRQSGVEGILKLSTEELGQ